MTQDIFQATAAAMTANSVELGKAAKILIEHARLNPEYIGPLLVVAHALADKDPATAMEAFRIVMTKAGDLSLMKAAAIDGLLTCGDRLSTDSAAKDIAETILSVRAAVRAAPERGPQQARGVTILLNLAKRLPDIHAALETARFAATHITVGNPEHTLAVEEILTYIDKLAERGDSAALDVGRDVVSRYAPAPGELRNRAIACLRRNTTMLGQTAEAALDFAARHAPENCQVSVSLAEGPLSDVGAGSSPHNGVGDHRAAAGFGAALIVIGGPPHPS